MDDTIFAQATARGRAGVAIVRISGPGAFPAGRALAGILPEPRQAGLRRLTDPVDGAAIDQALVLTFPAPSSFTGEDILELHVHGSVAVTRALHDALAAHPGLRPAQPGEFTRRALQNGRVDLAQVEGLSDLIAAETAAQRRQALATMDGVISRMIADWRSRLTHALAYIEVGIDFSDEDLPEGLLADVTQILCDVSGEMTRELAGSPAAERLREGFEVALVGKPNVGKSTLLNALARRDAALTSEMAGTTRDVIEVRLDAEGLPLTFLDMAGLRDSDDAVERAGVARARLRAEAADIRLFLLEESGDVASLGVAPQSGDLIVLNKADLRPVSPSMAVSGASGAGLAEMLTVLAAELHGRVASGGNIAHVRQRDAIARAVAALAAAAGELGQGEGAADIAAEEIRTALAALDIVVGRVDVEAVLDVVFASFCLGK